MLDLHHDAGPAFNQRWIDIAQWWEAERVVETARLAYTAVKWPSMTTAQGHLSSWGGIPENRTHPPYWGCFNAGPPFMTLGNHYNNTGSKFRRGTPHESIQHLWHNSRGCRARDHSCYSPTARARFITTQNDLCRLAWRLPRYTQSQKEAFPGFATDDFKCVID